MSSVIVAKASVILAFKFVISGTGVENTLPLTYPHKNKSRWGGVISGDHGGQDVGPSPPIHLFVNVAPKKRRTFEPQCGGAPSCWKNLATNLSSCEKYIHIPRNFLVVNVFNQGKNLWSPCTINFNLVIKKIAKEWRPVVRKLYSDRDSCFRKDL